MLTESKLCPILIGMEQADMAELCRSAGVKPVHAETLLAHVFRHHTRDIRAIPDLPQALYGWLEQHTQTLDVSLITQQNAKDGTRKMLLAMPDGKEVETVLIPEKRRLTQCISTQIGCALNCSFCLTGTAGLTRNLSAAEMVAQIMIAMDHYDERASNLVLMGMGEPMHNYEEVARFVRIVTDMKGMAFSPRRVTISTAGHVPGIQRMTADRLPCNLALSLNATNDETRNRIMPINRRWPIAEVLHWAGVFVKTMHKRVLIEYVMLAGINDTDMDAKRLIQLLKEIPCTINLLPFNTYPGSLYQRPEPARISAFRRILAGAGKVVVVRESRGRDISAACGQLYASAKHNQQKIRQNA
jgi:23S rRNA (adenine2503-C2)-methyltransferase